MQRIILAIVAAAGICILCGPLLIPLLRRLKFGQQIRSDGPKAHLSKAGTPTMGGIMFFISIPTAVFLATDIDIPLAAVLLVTAGFGLIGFFDDFIKVVMKRTLGLRAREKIAGQILLSAVFVWVVVVYGQRGTDLVIPLLDDTVQLGWGYFPFAVFVMLSANNAVNITDGLDGLAAGVMLFSALGYLILTNAWEMTNLSIFSASLVGCCLGFLFYNIKPARVFMGDTGSLTLGGALGALAILTKTEILLILLGGVFVLETLSVIIQVVYFRLTGGKRFFRMSPLHHHFELSGWPEHKIVVLFWTVAAVFASFSVMIMIY